MNPSESPHLYHSKSSWVDWFMDGVINSDIDTMEANSVLHYLIDLNLFKIKDGVSLLISEFRKDQSHEESKRILMETINALSQTERGFALVYFFPELSEKGLPSLKTKNPSSEFKGKSLFGKKMFSKDKNSSNLSNLQIVKKWGNELRPFLDLEQQTIARLRGEHTSQEDAQRLFSYILDKTRKKSPAKKWEQLSRKRHR